MNDTDNTRAALEKRSRMFRADELMPEYIAAMQRDGSVTLPVSGTSMTPFLGHLRDSVTLAPVGERRLRCGDIALYIRRSEGRQTYVMHRIVGKSGRGYAMCGDAQTEIERWIAPSSIVAAAVGAKRKGRQINENSFIWLFFKYVWRWIRPLRPLVFRLAGKGPSAAKGK